MSCANVDERIDALKRDIVFTKIGLNDAWSRRNLLKTEDSLPPQKTYQDYPRESRGRGEVCYPREATAIVEWAMKNKGEFMQHSFQQWYLTLTPEIAKKLQPPRFIMDIKERIMKREKLHGYECEPALGDFINILERGTQVQLHQDRNYPPDRVHVRYNVHVQSGDGEDGLQICCNRVCIVPERNYSRCLAGMEPHTSTEICTDRARVGISFGFLIPLTELDIFEFTPSISF